VQPKDALAAARPAVFWLDRPDRPDATPPLEADTSADLVVVGAGYAGLWTAIAALEDRPGRDVVVIEAERVAEQASGRNGGFCSASLTHGLANGFDRFPDEIECLVALGRANLDAIEATIATHGIECSFERTGNLAVATAPWQVEALRNEASLATSIGEDVAWLDRDEIRSEVASPTYEGGYWLRGTEAMVDPARLAWGLARVARDAGARLYEHTPLITLDRSGSGMVVRTPRGSIRCGAVVLATNAFASPVRAIRRRIAPVYDHVLVTAPLDEAQRASIGWSNRQGISDGSNLFHYYRLTDDHRILWGGYDAVYHWRNRIDPSLEQRDVTHQRLAEHFAATFPQLTDVPFTHRWGGVIDTSTRFMVGFGTAFDGRVAYGVGYTGLGVGASRFGARVCLDLLDRPDSDLLDLAMVRRAPLPFPPEPLRWLGIGLTRRELERADRNGGRRGLWLRLLDRLGLGFDS
jgi:glycine/D-amino acid oxidase-like deaminating enzyme